MPGHSKPSSYLGFISFAIDLFDALAELGWPRLPDKSALSSTSRFAIESFPTSAWRTLGLKPLPGKVNTPDGVIEEKLAELASLSPLSIEGGEELTHDEVHALVAGLAGIATFGHEAFEIAVSGVPPLVQDGSYREGLIVNPTRRVASAPPMRCPPTT